MTPERLDYRLAEDRYATTRTTVVSLSVLAGVIAVCAAAVLICWIWAMYGCGA